VTGTIIGNQKPGSGERVFSAQITTLLSIILHHLSVYLKTTFMSWLQNMQNDVDLANGSLHTVEIGSFINVSAVYAASILRRKNIRSTYDTGYILWTDWYCRNCPTTPTESSGKRHGPK
jgi:hypothetical protein